MTTLENTYFKVSSGMTSRALKNSFATGDCDGT